MRLSLLSAVVLGLGGKGDPATVWVFFSPEAPDASRIFRELEGMGVKARPVLLPESYFGRRAPRREFLKTLRVSGEVFVVDTEGLRVARRLRIRELPAIAVECSRRTHVAAGNLVSVPEVMRCSR